MSSDDVVKIIVPLLIALISGLSPIIIEMIKAKSAMQTEQSKDPKLFIVPEGYKTHQVPKQHAKIPWKWMLALALSFGLISYILIAIVFLPTKSSISTIQPTLTPFSGRLLFTSPLDANVLSTELLWDAGSSAISGYKLSSGAIILTAGPHTWPDFPAIYYTQPVEGDFEVQVKINFKPPAPKILTAQMVGLAIRPINTRLTSENSSFPKDWVVAAKYITDAGSLAGCRGSWPGYSSDIVYVKIERGNNIWQCAYSENGENWTRLRVDVDSQSLSDKPLEISLFAYSITDDAITAEFSDWLIIRK